jgi:glyoxylase-like metal-dependent hydrolase (beta-lactamase superfamily II)
MKASKPTIAPFRVGEFDVLTIPDGSRSFPLPDGFIRNADRAQINEALVSANMKADEITIVFNPVVISEKGRHVLMDTGNGESANQSPTGPGQTRATLVEVGIAPEKIDLVVISHFHGDHINGLLRADGSPAFPNAAITVPEREWAFWTSDDERRRAQGGSLEAAFANVGRVLIPMRERIEQHRWGAEISPGITAMGTPGHTPGHTSYIVASRNSKLFVQSDVTNHPALFVRNPGWHAAFDMDPELAERTRRRVYEMLVSEKMPVQGFHFPLPSRGFVKRSGDGYHLVMGN